MLAKFRLSFLVVFSAVIGYLFAVDGTLFNLTHIFILAVVFDIPIYLFVRNFTGF